MHEREELLAAAGNVIWTKRLAVGLSQTKLAHQSGVSRNYISLIENCEHLPTLDTLFKLAFPLETTAPELVREIEFLITGFDPQDPDDQ